MEPVLNSKKGMAREVLKEQNNFYLEPKQVRSLVYEKFGKRVSAKDVLNARYYLLRKKGQKMTEENPSNVRSSEEHFNNNTETKRSMVLTAFRTLPNASDSDIMKWVKSQYGVTVSRSWVVNLRENGGRTSSNRKGMVSGRMQDPVNAIQLAKSLIEEMGSVEDAVKLLEIVGS